MIMNEHSEPWILYLLCLRIFNDECSIYFLQTHESAGKLVFFILLAS